MGGGWMSIGVGRWVRGGVRHRTEKIQTEGKVWSEGNEKSKFMSCQIRRKGRYGESVASSEGIRIG